MGSTIRISGGAVFEPPGNLVSREVTREGDTVRVVQAYDDGTVLDNLFLPDRTVVVTLNRDHVVVDVDGKRTIRVVKD